MTWMASVPANSVAKSCLSMKAYFRSRMYRLANLFGYSQAMTQTKMLIPEEIFSTGHRWLWVCDFVRNERLQKRFPNSDALKRNNLLALWKDRKSNMLWRWKVCLHQPLNKNIISKHSEEVTYILQPHSVGVPGNRPHHPADDLGWGIAPFGIFQSQV